MQYLFTLSKREQNTRSSKEEIRRKIWLIFSQIGIDVQTSFKIKKFILCLLLHRIYQIYLVLWSCNRIFFLLSGRNAKSKAPVNLQGNLFQWLNENLPPSRHQLQSFSPSISTWSDQESYCRDKALHIRDEGIWFRWLHSSASLDTWMKVYRKFKSPRYSQLMFTFFLVTLNINYQTSRPFRIFTFLALRSNHSPSGSQSRQEILNRTRHNFKQFIPWSFLYHFTTGFIQNTDEFMHSGWFG